MFPRGRLPREVESLGIDPDDLRGRVVTRQKLHELTDQAFGRLFGTMDPAEMKRLAKARGDLLSFTQEMMPNYKADRFHKHLAGELTKIVREGHGYLMIEAPPQHGKRLAHPTPVLTTHGWKEHGVLRVGDRVFDRQGRPTEVIAIAEEGDVDLEIEFTDGALLKCHPGHEWRVFDRRSAGGGHSAHEVVLETRRLQQSGLWLGRQGKRGGRARFQLDGNIGVEGSEGSLLIEPYVLGLWLGDGRSAGARFSFDPRDVATVDRVARLGFPETSCLVHSTTGVHDVWVRHLHPLLRRYDLIRNKHIPPAYLVVSRDQRLQLLAGLMDSDGYVYPLNGRACFSNTNERLIQDTARLVASLGWRPTIASYAPKRSTSGIEGRKTVYQLTFTPTEALPCALERKAICRPPIQRRRGIVDIRPARRPEPGRCIQVAAPNGIYLVGPTLIPTHNSTLVSQMLPPFWLALKPDQPILLTSYGAERAVENSRNARAIAMSPVYGRLFGTRTPELAKWRANHWAFEGAAGFVYATGVGGAVTGLGFGAAVVDDPHQSWEDAQSETMRRRIWEWWQGTFIPRLWEGAPIFFITTRWNEDDLAGRVLQQEGRIEEGGRWKVLRYPALAEEENEERGIEADILGRKPGEPLAPSRFSRKFLEGTREIVGPLVWSAEWQQRPTRPEGFLFKIGRFEIKDADEVPVDMCTVVNGKPVDIKMGLRFWDLAATAKAKGKRDPDWLSGTLESQDKAGHYWVLDQVLERLDPEQVDDIIQQTADLDGVAVKIRMEQEGGASGKLLINDYGRSLAGFDFEGMLHSGDKLVWADPWAKQVNAGNVYLLRGPWNKAFIAEHGGFPNADHDDQIDSAAGAFHGLTALKRRWRKQKFTKV